MDIVGVTAAYLPVVRLCGTHTHHGQTCCHNTDLFNLYSECLTKEALDGLGDFKVGGQIIQTVKCADGLVLTAKEEMVLQDMIGKLTATGRYCGMEINVEKKRN